MSESRTLRPDGVLTPHGTTLRSRDALAEAVRLIPNMAKLVARLVLDPRVPQRSKLVLGLAAAYAASPIDLLPDVIPVVGWADDLLVLMFALDNLIARAGPDIVQEHWDGPGDLLGLVSEVVGLARAILPRRVGFVIDRLAR